MRVLVLSEERGVTGLGSALTRMGMAVTTARTAEQALTRLPGVDVLLLDLDLPDRDGAATCRTLRRRTDAAVILLATAPGLGARTLVRAGAADEYLRAPAAPDDVLACIRAVRRRRGHGLPDGEAVVVLAPDVLLDRRGRMLLVDGDPVPLRPKELGVLTLLVDAAGTPCTREELVAAVWGRSWAGASRTLDVHVASLRAKLGHPGLVTTVRGVGFVLTAPGPMSAGA